MVRQCTVVGGHLLQLSQEEVRWQVMWQGSVSISRLLLSLLAVGEHDTSAFCKR